MIDYNSCVRSIRKRCRCDKNEAWEGLNEAFLSLDKSLPERAQYWWLIRVGSWNVLDSIRQRYIGKSGVIKFVSSDFKFTPAPHSDENEWDFLNAFPEGLVREFAKRVASGKSSLTLESARHWLRKHHKTSSRTTSKEVINEVRICSKRV